MEVVKRYKIPLVRYISSRDVMYNVVNIIITAGC